MILEFGNIISNIKSCALPMHAQIIQYHLRGISPYSLHTQIFKSIIINNLGLTLEIGL